MYNQPDSASQPAEIYDYVVIGSGFGGSVSAMRLTEKGHKVLVLERGKRYHDQDFPKHNWNFPRYLWIPALRWHGIQEITVLKNVVVGHGTGVGGGSLVYANVLMEPDDRLFDAPGWRDLADWKSILRPHYQTARRMLGVAPNPLITPADITLKTIATEMKREHTFRTTEVGVFFGEEGKQVADPYFGGDGPPRAGCTHCGGCMVGCRYNAKNTLLKNYLYFAENWGAHIQAEASVKLIRALPDNQPDGARYEIIYHRSTAWFKRDEMRVRTRNIVLAAGVLGTLSLLFHCRDVARTLPRISSRLGEQVRTNSEALLGVTTRKQTQDYSKGVAITSVFRADDETHIQPVRFPQGSSFFRTLSAPLIKGSNRFLSRALQTLGQIAQHPLDYLNARLFPYWANRSTIMLIMQTKDNMIRLRTGRSWLTLFRRGLISEQNSKQPLEAHIDIGHNVTRAFAKKTDGIPQAALNESLFNIPSTAHILGGCPFGRDESEGVVNLKCEVFNYPGLYIVDGSIMPANPGINPSLTITALAEYAMSHIPPKEGQPLRPTLMREQTSQTEAVAK